MSGFKIIKKEEPLQKRPVFITIYGLPGVGKTSLMNTMPGEVLHFDFDQGISRSVQKVRPDSIAIDEYGPFYDWVFSDDFEQYIIDGGYKTVSIDTVGTMLEDYVAPWLISKNPKAGTVTGGLSLSGWGQLSTHFNNFKNRLKGLGLEIGAICHAKEQGDDSQYRLAVKGGSSEVIQRTCDMLGFMHVVGENRILDFNPTQAHIGKNMVGFDPIAVPNSKTDAFDGFGSFLVDKIKERMVEVSKRQVEHQEKVDEYKEWLKDCQKPADFDALIASLAEEPSKLLKAQVKKLMRPALEEAKCFYNTETGKVEHTPQRAPDPEEEKQPKPKRKAPAKKEATKNEG